MSNAKVQVSEQGPFFYPDVVITCDQRDRTSTQVIHYPSIIIEVLSPSTKSYDRGEKFQHYRRLETLNEYALINAETMGIEIFRLNETKHGKLSIDQTMECSKCTNHLLCQR